MFKKILGGICVALALVFLWAAWQARNEGDHGGATMALVFAAAPAVGGGLLLVKKTY